MEKIEYIKFDISFQIWCLRGPPHLSLQWAPCGALWLRSEILDMVVKLTTKGGVVN